MCAECAQRLSSQQRGLCQLTGCCPLAPQLLSSALLCDLELVIVNIFPLPAATVVSTKVAGGTLRGLAGEETSLSVSCVIFPQWLWLPAVCVRPYVIHSPSSVLLAPQWEDSCGPVLVCQHPSRCPPAPQHQPAAPPSTSLEPQQTASCGPVLVCGTRAYHGLVGCSHLLSREI